MSVQAITVVLDFAPPDWPVSTRLVAIALADRVNSETNTTWASIADLARRTGLGERQVQRHLRRMEADGVIRREKRDRADGSQASNTWHWLWTTSVHKCGQPTRRLAVVDAI